MLAPDVGGRLPACTAAMAVALLLSGQAGTARAAEVLRYDFQGAAAICQPATNLYAAQLRSRPLGLVNEGTTAAFVSCALASDPRPAGRGAMKVLVEVGASSNVTGGVSCTFVDGLQQGASSDAVYRTKSTLLSAGARGVALTWQPSEIAGAPEHIFRPAVQCMLGPTMALHYLSVTYDEDIGG